MSMPSAQSVVTRAAPSPTGFLHIGTARTALFNYLFARKNGGTFILRLEDTDRERSREAYADNIRESLSWLSLKPDIEVRQSEQSVRYRRHISRLLESGVAYLSREPSKKDPSAEVTVVRFRNAESAISFTDTVHGTVTASVGDLGDFVIARSADDPLYHLAAVIDDMESGVTHILRGDDHLANTPRQIALIRALGGTPPSYTHIPLIHSPSGGKLSKRKDAVSVLDFKNRGYLPEAVINALALLGWNPKDERELFTLEELVDAFSPEHIQKREAVFDGQKLKWFNRQYLRKADESVLRREIVPVLVSRFPLRSRLRPRSVRAVLRAVRERGVLLQEERDAVSGGMYDFYFIPPSYEPSLLLPKSDLSADALTLAVIEGLERTSALLRSLSGYTEWYEERIREALWSHAETHGKALVLWPLRFALSGAEKSPGPFEIAGAIGRRQTLLRLRRALASLRGMLR